MSPTTKNGLYKLLRGIHIKMQGGWGGKFQSQLHQYSHALPQI